MSLRLGRCRANHIQLTKPAIEKSHRRNSARVPRFVATGWHGQVLLPVVSPALVRTGKSTCPCHPNDRRRCSPVANHPTRSTHTGSQCTGAPFTMCERSTKTVSHCRPAPAVRIPGSLLPGAALPGRALTIRERGRIAPPGPENPRNVGRRRPETRTDRPQL